MTRPPGLPTFFVLGAAKCGTTSLHYMLSQHPDVLMAQPKEPVFFEAEYERGLAYYAERYFGEWSGQRAVGEARGANLLLPYVAPRIHADFPEARLIAILRHPVDRAYSHWWMRHTRGWESLSFADAIADNEARLAVRPWFEGPAGEEAWRATLLPGRGVAQVRTYLDLGFYADQLERYLRLYPRGQLRVLLLEDLQQDPGAVMNELFGFIGVAPQAVQPDTTPQNVATTRGRTRLVRFVAAAGVGKIFPRALRDGLKARLTARKARRPALDPALRQRLCERYAPQTARLEALLGRDLSHWKR